MTLGSLFSGVGGFELAARRAGIDTVWQSEIEKFCVGLLAERFPNAKQLGDIRNINGAEIEPVDIVSGGFPCQDASVAGTRQGLSGERTSLIHEALRIIKEMRVHNGKPRYGIFENVMGLFSVNGGEDFRTIIEEICRVADETVVIPKRNNSKWTHAGCVVGDCFSIAWRVLDARYFGVPQRRRRIFIVADFGGQSAPEILLKPASGAGRFEPGGTPGEEAAAGTGNGVEGASGSDCMTPPVAGFAYKAGATAQGIGYEVEVSATLKTEQTMAVYDARGNGDGKTASTLTGDHTNRVSDYTTLCLDRAAFNQGVNAKYDFNIDEELAATVVARGPSAVYTAAQHVRRLTPLECERLQGFPDGWLDVPGASDTAKYRATGNAIAIPCVEWIFKRMGEMSK